MAILENILSQEIVQRLGWVLIHFIWQAGAVAIILAIVLKILRKSSANVRYIIACLALGLTALLPVVTMRLVSVSGPDAAVAKAAAVESAAESIREAPVVKAPVLREAAPVESAAAIPRVGWKERFVSGLEPALPYIVFGWLVGVLGLSIWHLGGWTQLQRLRQRMVKQVSERVHLRLSYLSEQLGVKRAIEIAESALVQVPTVVGWLKPVILLPGSALTGLSGEQLEAILAHELAHIKRHDYLVNMLQTVVEILGFYHPAVWWVSHKIRVERENCCDDLAVSVSGGRVRYARALTSMEEVRGGYSLAVAASGGSLFERIRRLVGKDSADSGRGGWLPSVIATVLILALVISVSFAMSSRSKSEYETITHKDKEELSEFKKTLPNNVNIELVGICEYPSAGKKWWGPDGYFLDQQIVTVDASNYTNKAPAYEIVYKITAPDDVTISDFPRIKGAVSQSGLTVKKPSGLRAVRAHIDKWGKTTTVAFGIAAGQWKTIVKTSGTSQTSTQIGSGKLMFGPAEGTKEKLILTVSDDIEISDDYRLIGIDNSGNVFQSSLQWFSVKGLRQSTFVFTNLEPDSIDHFEFQTRTYEWIKFKNVSLKPHLKTDAEVGPEKLSAWGRVEELQKRMGSAKKLSVLGKGMLIFASAHDEKYPEDVDELLKAEFSKAELDWFKENLEYLGHREKPTSRGGAVLAYDKTLLGQKNSEGTNVLYNDGHVAFERTEQLEGLGITAVGVEVEKPSTENDENTENPEFTATLPNGVTVELMGVCEHPSEGKQWWGPDGFLLKKAPYDKIQAPYLEQLFSGVTADKQRVELALRIITLTKIGDVGWRMESSGRIFYMEKILKDGRSALQLKALLAAVSSEDKTIEVKLSINGSWIRFKNVALRPNLKTNVQIEVGTSSAAVGERVVRFPEGRSLGALYVRDGGSAGWYEDWEEFGEAKGDISIPADKELKLEVSEAGVGELSALSELGADDLQMLGFGWKEVILGSLAPIGNLRGLKALILQRTRFEAEDFKYLTGLSKLRVLRLGDHKLTDESMRYIGELTSLRSLALWGTGISDEGLKHLQDLRNLTFLALNGCDITDEGLGYLENMTSLEGLQLTQTKITDEGLSKLKGLSRLKSILIGYNNNITDAGFKHLQGLGLLEIIGAEDTAVSDKGLSYLSAMQNLEGLTVFRTKVTDAGMAHLSNLKSLKHLTMSDIGDEGVEHLSELPALKKLQILDARVTKASIGHFEKMRSVERVLLSGDEIGDDLLEALRAALPGCKIWDPQRSLDYPMPAWRKKFEAIYRLKDGQILRRIAPPFIPERRDYYVNEHSYQAEANSRSPDGFVFHWDKKLKIWGSRFGKGHNLNSTLNGVLGLKSFEYEGPEELLSLELPGDWIIRDKASQEVKLRALEQLLAEEVGKSIRFTKRPAEREVIVATGSFKFYPLSETDKQVYMYSGKFDPDAGGGGGTAKSVSEFLGTLGNRIGVPVIDETLSSGERKIVYRHHRSAYFNRVKDETEKAKKLEMLLANLTKQTDLKFRLERRPVGVWFVTEGNGGK